MPPEFSIRSDSVDVEQIMKQIRDRIREKRGVDYTEEELRELANVKLEKFLEPARLRSGLLETYRSRQPVHLPPASSFGMPASIEVPPAPPNYAFEADAPYQSSRGVAGWLLFALRRALNPILKLFINPNPIVHVIRMQSAFNAQTTDRFDRMLEQLNVLNTQWLERLQENIQNENSRRNMDALNYEIAHNLVLEMTRLSMDVKNMKMRVESISSRLDFAERRARALENVVQYRPGSGPVAEVARQVAASRPVSPATPAAPQPETPAAPGVSAKGEAQRRRRRRRRGRGGSSGAPGQPGAPADAGNHAEDRDGGAGDDLFTETRHDADDREAPEPPAETGAGTAPADEPRDPDPAS